MEPNEMDVYLDGKRGPGSRWRSSFERNLSNQKKVYLPCWIKTVPNLNYGEMSSHSKSFPQPSVTKRTSFCVFCFLERDYFCFVILDMLSGEWVTGGGISCCCRCCSPGTLSNKIKVSKNSLTSWERRMGGYLQPP
ncbi:hypothetical protein AVEN_259360-1 [Araneus ventricosus]|uniref:Uncharacterized protein n=1 Tax=Araneus ventricosus TaxID=182803 RepID=A0A4Y2DTV2_ARAVE|nr:hypothetical protein AVEN_259360-1 [Araneus ventricosus]